MIKTSQSDGGKEPFFLDWTDFYTRHGLDPAVDLITASTWVVTGGVKGVEFIDTPETGVFISGGVAGSEILAKNTIEIGGGTYADSRTLKIEVF